MSSRIKCNKYALITPARNEEKCIAYTLNSVVSQINLPEIWIIVSDGSTDKTDQIVKKYSDKYGFIKLLKINRRGSPNFSAKVAAFNTGYDQLGSVDYDFIGNFDADISFKNTYTKRIMEKFVKNPKLGLAGGIIMEKRNNKFVPQNISLNSVAGAVQFFRRECFEETRGYIPLRYGGVDAAIEILARMKGWEVRTFLELGVKHYGRVTTGRKNILATKFQQGITNYKLGYHPAFQIISSIARFFDTPYLSGSIAVLIGYFWAAFRKKERAMPMDAVRYLRDEQMQRIVTAVSNLRRR